MNKAETESSKVSFPHYNENSERSLTFAFSAVYNVSTV